MYKSDALQYRLLGITDLAELQQVGRATYAPYYPHIWYEGGMDWYMERCFGRDNLLADFADPNIAYYFAQNVEGEVVGLLKLGLRKAVPDTARTNALYLEKIYLMPAFLGQGAGRKMMDFVCDKARAMGREAVWLMVMQTGPMAAYERAGFQVVGATHWDFDFLRVEQRGGYVMLRELA
jgi:GNAT superfamily N-acetyltransferase